MGEQFGLVGSRNLTNVVRNSFLQVFDENVVFILELRVFLSLYLCTLVDNFLILKVIGQVVMLWQFQVTYELYRKDNLALTQAKHEL